jgi:hypothetical protein
MQHGGRFGKARLSNGDGRLDIADDDGSSSSKNRYLDDTASTTQQELAADFAKIRDLSEQILNLKTSRGA